MEPNIHKLIVVLGMHRGGTSVVARGLGTLGVQLGNNLMPPGEDNPTGYWEDLDIYALNVEMLNFLHCDWHCLTPIQADDIELLRKNNYFQRAFELLRKKTDGVPIFGFKDPRVTKLLSFWKIVFTQGQFNTHYILVIRNPLSVCISLAKRNGFDLEKGYWMWLEHTMNSFTGTDGERRIVVDFDRLMKSPDAELSRMAKELHLQIDNLELEKFKLEFLDNELRHTVYSLDDLTAEKSVPPLVREVYSKLLDVAANRMQIEDATFKNSLQQWDEELVRLKSILVFADKLGARIAEREQTVQSLTAQVAEKERSAQGLAAQLAEKGQSAQALAAQLAEKEQYAQALAAQLAEKEHSVQALSAQVAEKGKSVQVLMVQAKEMERSAKTLSAQLEEKEKSAQALAAQVAYKEQELTEIKSGISWKSALLLRRILSMFAPSNSYRDMVVNKLFNLIVVPISRIRQKRNARNDLTLIRTSDFFDATWYLSNNPDVGQAKIDPALHYLQYGGFEGRDPGPNFSSNRYLNANTDVYKARANPLFHYLKFGKKEGRVAYSPAMEFNKGEIREINKIKVRNQQKKPPLIKLFLGNTVNEIYFIYHRLPVSVSIKQIIQRFVHKFFPSVYNNYKRTINGIIYQHYLKNAFSKRDNSTEEYSLPDTAKSDESGLALWASLLDVDKASLVSLFVPPPWEIENHEEGSKNIQSEQSPETTIPQVLFTIVLFVDNPPTRYLNNCIRSVLEQSYKYWNLKIIVNEDGLWNTDGLAAQFIDWFPRINVKSARFTSDVIQEFKNSVLDSEGEYIIFLNSYDELKPDALYQAANEIMVSQCDLLYYPDEVPLDTINREFSKNQSWPEESFAGEIAFSQFILWRKAYLESLFPEHLNSPLEDIIYLRNEFTGIRKPQLVKTLASPCYFFRQIPGRMSITLINKEGGFDLAASSIPLRILVDARPINRQITGTERYILELLEALSLLRKKYDIDLKAIVFSQPKKPIDGIKFITARHLEAIRQCHVFHKTFPASDGLTLAEMALAPSVVFTPLDMILYTNPDYFFNERDYYHYRKTMQLAANLADRIIGISNHGKMEIETLLHVPGKIVSSIYLGVRPECFSPEKQESRYIFTHFNIPSQYFLYVGTDYPHKNLITLLRAFFLVRQHVPTAYLVLVGVNYYGHPQPEIDELMHQMSSYIFQLGHVPDDILPALYHKSSALVYPSLYEGFGLPILEAMLCGTPIIASNATSIPEICGNDSAILLDGRDEKQIADAMMILLDDSQLRSRLVVAGHNNAANFKWEKTAIQTIRCYRDAINNAMRVSSKKRSSGNLLILNNFRISPPTVLIVTHVRFYPPTAGNEQRLFRIAKYLKGLGYQVVMLVNPFLETAKLDRDSRSLLHQYVDYYEEIGDVKVDETNDVRLESQIGNETILDKWKATEESFCSNAVMHRAKKLIEEFSPNILLAEYIWTSRVFALATPDMLKVIDTIDMFSKKNENVIKFGIHDTLSITPSEELAFFNRSDAIISIQNSETDAFRKLAPSCRILSAGIDFDVGQLTENAGSDAQSSTLLIVGSGNHINVHCVKEFLNQSWPVIRKNAPSCKLRIVGKVCNSLITEDRDVELIPYIKDLDAAYKEAAIVVNPVYAGTGLKVKSVEALGHGKALVCWPEGVSGVDTKLSKPFIIIHSWEELSQSVVELVIDKEKRRGLERAARNFAKSTLSDKVVYRELADCFDIFCGRKLKVLCLYLRYGNNDFPEGISDLQTWQENKMGNAKVTTWIIDNKIKGDVDGVDLATGFRLLSGNNEEREFSAFQKILTQHREEIESYDVIHFVTSAFNTLFTGYLDYFSIDQLELVAHRPICLGHIDSYDEPVYLTGEISQCWIRTCFFFMSPETIYSISNFVSFQDESAFFDADGNFLDGNISKNYQKYISGWLNGESIQGVSWHSRIQDSNSFKGKSLAILNEHMLSARLQKAGVSLIDFYWVKENIQILISSFDYMIPNCKEQVIFRQAGLFGPMTDRSEHQKNKEMNHIL